MKPEIPEVDSGMRQTAVSVYSDLDDFPVLKAFQQYIDAEQARARKRLMTFGIIFGVLMICVIAVFVGLLYSSNQRNQTLNDRLVEFAMRDRDRQSAVVVQPPIQQDNSAIIALTAKMDELQQKLLQSQKKAEEAEKARAEAAAKAALEAQKPKEPSPAEIELKRQQALLEAEKKKLEAEKAKFAAEQSRRRQEELEAYRRKHYPDLYEKPKVKPSAVVQQKPPQKPVVVEKPAVDEDLDDADDSDTLDDSSAINYFSEERTSSGDATYSIPVDVRGSKSKWRIPKD